LPYRSLLGALMALLIGVGLGGSSGFAAERTARRAPLGSVTATGPVWLNQPPGRESSGIPPGTALFAGDVIQTGKAGAALVRLLSGISASIAEQSSVTLLSGSGPAEQRGSHGIASIGQRGSHGMVSIEQRGSHGMVSMPWIRAEGAARSAAIPTLDLRQGALVALNGGPQPARVEIQGAAVILRGQPGLPAVSRVSVVGRSAAVFADRGRVEVHGAGRPVILAPGERVELVDGRAAGPASIAGKVTDSFPYEEVLHPGESVEVPLKLGELVSVGDAIRTLETGRVRIQLLDGSFVSLGPRSKMQVVKHDPGGQQSEIDLKWGYLRGEIGKSSASIRVRTPTATLDAAGAIFVVGADGKHTRACAVKGLVTVRNVDPAVSGAVKLNDGECTLVALAHEPRSPKESPAALRLGMRRTEVPGISVAATLGQPGAVPVAGRPSALGVGMAATDGVAAGLAAAGFILTNDATGSLDAAKSHLSHVANSANAAASDADAALAAAKAAQATANSVGCALNTFSDENYGIPSPYQPPPGSTCP